MGARLQRNDLPDDYWLNLYGDTHIGARACAWDELKEFLDDLGPNNLAIHMGDIVEGQTTDHPHYDRESVDIHTPGGQFEAFIELVEETEAADHHLGILQGNHDWRYDKVHNFTRQRVCQRLEIDYLGTMAHVILRSGEGAKPLNAWLAHKTNDVYSMAKDPEQRQANKKAMLRRRFEDMWSSAHLCAAGHVHRVMVVEPMRREQVYAGEEAEFETIRAEDRHYETAEGSLVIPRWAKWMGISGTFRHGGYLEDVGDDYGANVWNDYSHQQAHEPEPAGYIRFKVEDGTIVDGEEVYI